MTDDTPDDKDSFNLSGFQKDEPEDKKPANDAPPENTEKEAASANEENVKISEEADTEPAEISPSALAPEQGFIFLVKQSFGVFIKKIWVFLGLALLNIVILAVLYLVLLPVLMSSMMNMGMWALLATPLIFGLLQAFLMYLFYGTIANQAFNAYNGISVTLMESLSGIFKITGRAINLGFKIFIYSGIWLVIVFLILSAVSTTVLSGMGGNYGALDTAYAADSNLIAQSGLIGTTYEPTRMGGEAPGGFRNLILTISQFVFGLGGLLVIIIAMVRFVRTSMAFPILMGNPEASAKEALDESIRLTKGKWWLVVCFGFVFTFLLALIPVLVQINAVLMGSQSGIINIVILIVSLLFGLLSFPLVTAFYQVFAIELSNEARTLKLHAGMIVLTVLIFLSPYIIAFAAPFLLFSIIGSGLSGYQTDNMATLSATPFEMAAISSTPVILGAPARARDAARMGDLNKLIAAIEVYNADNGEYPGGYQCIEQMYKLSQYFPSGLPEDPNGEQDFGFALCEAGYYYQSSDENIYALWARMEDPLNGNADSTFTNSR